MTEFELTLLIRKYLSGEATEEEQRLVEQWYESSEATHAKFLEDNNHKINDSADRSLEVIREKIARRLAEEQKGSLKKPGKAVLPLYRWAASAAVLIVISGTIVFLKHKTNNQQPISAVTFIRKNIQPGGNKAILTLGNGQQIMLDSSHAGQLSVQGSTRIIKMNNGQLAYSRQPVAGGGATGTANGQNTVLYNTITTPRGGQYMIVLPDGSKVWLNAASSVRFPTEFNGTERKIALTGEAYFEVADNAKMPFYVSVGGVEVQVLGTHFNVNAYKDEVDTKVTLLQGLVRVSKPLVRTSQLLTANEQARINKDGEIQLVKHANVDEAIAWKNNLFWFNDDDIQAIARQISRWYDADVVIKGDIPDLFTGFIPRNVPLSKVFELLQETGSIRYKIENGKIIVSP